VSAEGDGLDDKTTSEFAGTEMHGGIIDSLIVKALMLATITFGV
jgi:hypothetical protein